MTFYPLTDGFTLLVQRDSEAPAEARVLRDEVFVKEQAVSIEEEYDGLDNLCTHFVLMRQEKPLATARLRPYGAGYKLERMAVDANFRTHGLGRMLMEFILSQPELTGVEVMLHAQLQAAGFYVKLGFSPEGEHFEEADIWHVKMKRRG